MRPLRTAHPLGWGFILLAILLMLLPAHAAGQLSPDGKPEVTPFFHDVTGLFSDEELGTLNRDAQLLQSSGIPTLVYVRSVGPSDFSFASSRAFADEVRRSWGIESATGADDGLVLLLTWVPLNPRASNVVFSYGESTFAGTGLTPEAIQETIDTSLRSLIEQEKPFETLVYLMRETRYAGIYTPPPPPPLEGAAKTLHGVLQWAGPASAAAAVLALAWVSARFWHQKPAPQEVARLVAVGLAAVVLLWALSVQAQSRVGVASSFLVLGSLATATFAWSRAGFISHGSPFVRHRRVLPTDRLMRKRRQARAIQARTEGNAR